MEGSKENCHPQCLGFSNALPTKPPIKLSLKSGFGKMENPCPEGSISSSRPRYLEDPQRALSMPRLPKSPFGEIRHCLRKKQDTL